MERKVDAPEQEWLSLRELAKWLNVSPKLLRMLIGKPYGIPNGVPFGYRTRLWHWQDAVAISIVLRWRKREEEEAARTGK